MGYLDSTSTTVDAVLTKKGRELLKTGQGLDITAFTVSDTGVDYTLWNPDQPTGSAFYGEAIENTPMLEANVHSQYALRDRLVTLPQNTISMPALEIQLQGTTGNNLTFTDSDAGNTQSVTVNLKGYVSAQAPMTGGGHKLYVIIQQPAVTEVSATAGVESVTDLSGIAGQWSRESGIHSTDMYAINATQTNPTYWSFHLSPKTTDRKEGLKTAITVIDGMLGVYNSFTVTNNVTRLERDMLGKNTIIGGV